MREFDLSRQLSSEALGTTLLVAVVVGSGIMGDLPSARPDRRIDDECVKSNFAQQPVVGRPWITFA